MLDNCVHLAAQTHVHLRTHARTHHNNSRGQERLFSKTNCKSENVSAANRLEFSIKVEGLFLLLFFLEVIRNSRVKLLHINQIVTTAITFN